MKTKLKRFLSVIPVVLCLVLSLAVPLSTSAVTESDFYDYSTLDHDLTNYFIIKFAWGSQCWTYGIFLDDGFYDVSESNGLVTVTCATSHDVRPRYMYRSSDTDTRYTREDDLIHSFTWNDTNQELICYNMHGKETHHVVHSSENPVIDYDYDLWSSNALDVSVVFQPDLSGSVDRTVTDGSGASGLSQQFRMTVTNNSRFTIQYDMQIVKTEQTNLRDWNLSGYSSAQEFNETSFDDDPIFIYYDNDWVYAHSLDDSGSYFNGMPTKQQKSTQYHYLAAGASDDVTFNYSQINLVEGCSYTVTVRAVKCDYDCASELLINAIEDVYPEMKQISLGDLEVVYSSSFSMLQYKDVKYDPSDTSNGVVPYDGSKGLSFKERYANSYDAVETSSGSVDYKSKNLYDDPNSFLNKTYDPSSYPILYPNSRSGFSNTPSSVNNLSASISNFGSFLQSIFSYFPSGVFAIFNLALVMVVIIAIIKVVR